MRHVSALLMGLIFGVGLAWSGMTDPMKVLAFLDLAGAWDPTLAFVMGGALLVNLPLFWLTRKRGRPLFEERFALPTRQDLDPRLIGGSALFGIGWGIGGFCPGPALASLGSGAPVVIGFVGMMLLGMWLADRIPARSAA